MIIGNCPDQTAYLVPKEIVLFMLSLTQAQSLKTLESVSIQRKIWFSHISNSYFPPPYPNTEVKAFGLKFIFALVMCVRIKSISNGVDCSVPSPLNREDCISNSVENIFHLGQPLCLICRLIFRRCWGVWKRAPKNTALRWKDWLWSLFS